MSRLQEARGQEAGCQSEHDICRGGVLTSTKHERMGSGDKHWLFITKHVNLTCCIQQVDWTHKIFT